MDSRVLAIVVSALILAGSLSGCKPGVPSDILQPDAMEDILYDYHLADAMAQRKADYGYHQTMYREAVLKKYGITSAELDSSLLYYMRHTDLMHDIYEKLSVRLKDQALALGASESEVNRYSSMSASGDTANVWNGERALLLMPQAPYSVSSFCMVADSSYHSGDSFLLTFRCNYIYQEGMRDGLALLAVVYDNDSVETKYQRLPNSNEYILRIDNTANAKVKEVKGYFYLGRGSDSHTHSSTMKLMSVYDIHLVKLRAKTGKDSTSASGNGHGGSSADSIAGNDHNDMQNGTMQPEQPDKTNQMKQMPVRQAQPGDPIPPRAIGKRMMQPMRGVLKPDDKGMQVIKAN